MRAQGSYQTLRHHAEQGRVDEVGRNTKVEHPGDRRWRVIGVQGRQHKVTGQRRLDGHFCRFQITDFADHDDVRILPHQGSHAIGKADVDIVLNLHLVERGLDHFNRILDGADIDFRRRQLLERCVQRRGFAGTGRAGDQNNPVGRAGHLPPA